MKVAILEKYDKNGTDLVIKDVKIPEPRDNDEQNGTKQDRGIF